MLSAFTGKSCGTAVIWYLMPVTSDPVNSRYRSPRACEYNNDVSELPAIDTTRGWVQAGSAYIFPATMMYRFDPASGLRRASMSLPIFNSGRRRNSDALAPPSTCSSVYGWPSTSRSNDTGGKNPGIEHDASRIFRNNFSASASPRVAISPMSQTTRRRASRLVVPTNSRRPSAWPAATALSRHSSAMLLISCSSGSGDATELDHRIESGRRVR